MPERKSRVFRTECGKVVTDTIPLRLFFVFLKMQVIITCLVIKNPTTLNTKVIFLKNQTMATGDGKDRFSIVLRTCTGQAGHDSITLLRSNDEI